jgi:DNA-binding NtrC family response regulator
MQTPLLLVEDTPSLSMVYEAVLKKAGHLVDCVFNAKDAMQAYQNKSHRIFLLDLVLPDRDGLDLMREVLNRDKDVKVIVITANGSINRAVEAMRGGAFDFLVKPFDEQRLLSAVENARNELGEATQPLRAAEPEPRAISDQPDTGFEGFIGSSGAMLEIYRLIKNIGRSNATVFVTGESGTGKEVCAQAIHSVSSRAPMPFVPLNCGAIPSDLLESEVFGHLKGSFTGAIADKMGAAAAADKGTLFLDEICEMDLALQTKLLRFLQTSMIQPVGATTPRHVNVRIICATNRDPLEEVRAGRFREDLFYRLHVVPVHLPPLRERASDISEIALAFLRKFTLEEGKKFRRFSPLVLDRFMKIPWPGNVRQLINVVRNIVVLHDGIEVLPEMLPAEIMSDDFAPVAPQHHAQPAFMRSPVSAPTAPPQAIQQDTLDGQVGRPLAEVERDFIELTIRHCNGSIPKAARLLEVSPSTLYRKIESWKKNRSLAS